MSDSQPDDAVNLRIFWPLARWIEDVHGASALRQAAEVAGLSPDVFDGKTCWVPHTEAEDFLSAAYVLAADDETFMKACVHRFAESYGPVRYLFWALSQRAICETVVRNAHMVTRTGRFETVESGPQLFHVRYHSTVHESRAMCLSRQAQWAAGPTMWGLPAANLRELACISRGDAFCEYRLKWYERRRAVPLVAGAALGGAAGFAVLEAGLGNGLTALVLGALGAATAYAVEVHRKGTQNLAVGQEVVDALREASLAEAEARSELMALHQRQRDFLRAMEERLEGRLSAVEVALSDAQLEERSRTDKLRGVTHDIRNPLTVAKMSIEALVKGSAGDMLENALDVQRCMTQVEVLVTQVMDMLLREPIVENKPETLLVPALAESLRRRLRALTFGRDVKASVFATREAPAEIVINRILFDRIVDNLLTNAAKYTERGSIVLEVTGTPAHDTLPGDGTFLTLKLSDTGPGIPADRIRKVFSPKRPEEATTSSYGVGLASTVRLIDQLGGQITVMSKPGVGTTLWVFLPQSPRASRRPPPPGRNEALDSVISRVVKIRSAESA
ncbi:MAG: HAMP domain-containing histidine kinase [Myxococcales bacterium]|nr:HAMP domain-containing histidine kinase [Myxococcales bacterium]